MSRCDLDLLPLVVELLQHFGCHAFKPCTIFELNWIIHGWVIDDLARFRRAILGGEALLPNDSRGAWTQLHQTWPGHSAIISTQELCFRVWISRISCCIFKHERLKVEWCCTTNFALFDSLWKVEEGWARSLPTLQMTEPSIYIWWSSTAWLLSTVNWF